MISLLFLFPIIIFGQTLNETFKGKVLDKVSKTELYGANILLLDSHPPIGTTTDMNGNFRLQVPIGRHSFRVSYLGYESLLISDVIINAGKEKDITVELVESFSKLKEVVIKAETDKTEVINSMAYISGRQLRTEDAQRYAGGFYDPSRMVSSFAGVGAVEGDGLNTIVIRGNSPRGLLWKLEGIEIPNPNHFPDGQGDSGGAFSILSSTVLNNFDFYTGAFSAEYGNALSGILDIALRQGNNESREHSILVGLVGTQVCSEGPFRMKKNTGSYLVSYRYSNFGLLNKAGLLGLAENHLPPLFQDLSFNVNLPLSNAGSFSVFGVGGNSWTGWEPVKDSSEWKSFSDRKEEREKHLFGALGMKHSYSFSNKRTFIKSVFAYTYQRDKQKISYLNDEYRMINDFDNKYQSSSFRTNIQLNHKVNLRNSIRVGIMTNSLISSMYQSEYDNENQISDTALNNSNRTEMMQAYSQWKYRITENLELNTGLHSLYFLLNNSYSIEPRLGIQYSINSKQSLSMGLGLHSRIESIPVYFAQVADEDGSFGEHNKNLQPSKSIHSIAGYHLTINENLRFKMEAYYQYLFNIPIVDTVNSTISALNFSYGIPQVPLVNHGIGYNCGIEITLEKFYSRNYYFLVTVSVFDSKYKTNTKNWYNTTYNNSFISNVLLGKEYKLGAKKQNILGFNVKSLVRGGFRYTPIDIDKSSVSGEKEFNYSENFAKQFPLFTRLDLGVSFRKNGSNYNWIVSLDILNVLNHKNIMDYDLKYDEKLQNYSIVAIKGLGIVPNLNWRIEF